MHANPICETLGWPVPPIGKSLSIRHPSGRTLGNLTASDPGRCYYETLYAVGPGGPGLAITSERMLDRHIRRRVGDRLHFSPDRLAELTVEIV